MQSSLPATRRKLLPRAVGQSPQLQIVSVGQCGEPRAEALCIRSAQWVHASEACDVQMLAIPVNQTRGAHLKDANTAIAITYVVQDHNISNSIGWVQPARRICHCPNAAISYIPRPSYSMSRYQTYQ
jgi:hypothetical protein